MLEMGEPVTLGMFDLELVHDAAADVAESPLWDARRARLWWTDLLRGELHGYDVANGPITPISIGQSLGFVALTNEDGLLAGTREGFGLLDESFHLKVPVERDAPLRRMSDGKVDPQGRAWGGTLHDVDGLGGILYRLDSGWRVTLVREGLRIPNGIAWSGDGERMYITDSAGPTVTAWRYDSEAGVPVEIIHTITIEPGAGQPDGITVDTEDCVWVALWGGGAIRRYSPAGDLLAHIAMPCSLVTSVAFGGVALDELYVTSARYRMSADQLAREPHAGGIFRYRPGVRGREPHAYVV